MPTYSNNLSTQRLIYKVVSLSICLTQEEPSINQRIREKLGWRIILKEERKILLLNPFLLFNNKVFPLLKEGR